MARNCDQPSTRGAPRGRGAPRSNWQKPRNFGTGANDTPLGVSGGRVQKPGRGNNMRGMQGNMRNMRGFPMRGRGGVQKPPKILAETSFLLAKANSNLTTLVFSYFDKCKAKKNS